MVFTNCPLAAEQGLGLYWSQNHLVLFKLLALLAF